MFGSGVSPCRSWVPWFFRDFGWRTSVRGFAFDWSATRAQVGARLSPGTLDIVDTLAGQSTHFDAFFEGFARAGAQ